MRLNALVILALAACGAAGCRDAGPTVLAGEPAEGVPEALAFADGYDGKEDRVVSRCVTCGLAMPGKPKHSCSFGGYTLRMCSGACAGRVAEDPNAALLASVEANQRRD